MTGDDEHQKKDNQLNATGNTGNELNAEEADEKSAETAASTSKPVSTNSGFTSAFRKPLSDSHEDSVARKLENIQNQYQQISSAKKFAVSGISTAFGDLLKTQAGENNNSAEDELFGTTKTKSSEKENAGAAETTKQQTEDNSEK